MNLLTLLLYELRMNVKEIDINKTATHVGSKQ